MCLRDFGSALWRIPIVATIVCSVLLVAACVGQKRISELETENAALQDRVNGMELRSQTLDADLRAVVSSLDEAQNSAGDLESAVERFDHENWREVVPDVVEASSNVSSAIDALRANLNTLDRHLDSEP